MKFKLSSAVALQTADPTAALRFYSQTLGFPTIDDQGPLAIDLDPLTLYTDEQTEWRGILFELMTDDVEAAKSYLLENGCRVLRWEGAGKACQVEDPFGVRFNVYQQDPD